MERRSIVGGDLRRYHPLCQKGAGAETACRHAAGTLRASGWTRRPRWHKHSQAINLKAHPPAVHFLQLGSTFQSTTNWKPNMQVDELVGIFHNQMITSALYDLLIFCVVFVCGEPALTSDALGRQGASERLQISLPRGQSRHFISSYTVENHRALATFPVSCRGSRNPVLVSTGPHICSHCQPRTPARAQTGVHPGNS